MIIISSSSSMISSSIIIILGIAGYGEFTKFSMALKWVG